MLTTGLCFATPMHAADAKAKSKLTANDKKFVKKAYRGGMEEVANAKMAQDKAKDEATKKVAERMITDHTKANEELMSIANEEHLDLSGIHPKPATISGNDFDKEYLTMLQKDHKKDIAMFEKEASDVKPGEDRDVPAFARKTASDLERASADDRRRLGEDEITHRPTSNAALHKGAAFLFSRDGGLTFSMPDPAVAAAFAKHQPWITKYDDPRNRIRRLVRRA